MGQPVERAVRRVGRGATTEEEQGEAETEGDEELRGEPGDAGAAQVRFVDGGISD